MPPIAALVAALAAAVLLSPAAAVDRSYADTVQQARSLIREAMAGRSEAALQAARVLQSGTGDTQPEVLADLRRTPPDLVDADLRLAAVASALSRPARVSDPAAARAQVHAILAEPRYQHLRDGGSLWDRFWNWLVTTLLIWLADITSGSHPSWQWLLILAAAGLVTGLVTLAIVRSAWSRGKLTSTPLPASTPAMKSAAAFFAMADEAAGRGDHTGALRHLVAAVATAISGRPFWESSPLTVRELFRQSGEAERLRPLLTQFELAAYGGRAVDPEGYRQVAELAAPFRREPATAPAQDAA